MESSDKQLCPSKKETLQDADGEYKIDIRDRTSEFLHKRSAATTTTTAATVGTKNSNVTRPTSTVGCSTTNNISGYYQTLENFTELQSKVDDKVQALLESQQEYLRPSFRTDDEDAALQSEIERRTQDIRGLFLELDRMILHGLKYKAPVREPNTTNGSVGGGGGGVVQANFFDLSFDDEEIIYRNLKQHLSGSLARTLSHFKKAQEWYARELKRKEAKAHKYTAVDSDSSVYDLVAQEERTARFLGQGYDESQIQDLLIEEAQRQRVSEEIIDILKSLKDVQQMFTDLQELVVEQGTVLDRIDYNIDQAQVNLAKGLSELDKAKKYQESSSTCTIM